MRICAKSPSGVAALATIAAACLSGCSRTHLKAAVTLPTPPLQALANDALGKAYADTLHVLSDAVVFFYAKDGAGNMMPAGTGFLVAIPSKTQPNVHYVYLVTARHMVDGPWLGCPAFADNLVLRLNKDLKGPVTLEIGARTTVDFPLTGLAWKFAEDEWIDLAFALLPERINAVDAVVQPLKINNLATKEEADSLRVGDAIVSAGLLGGASGEWRNYPVFKWGHVSGVRGTLGEPLLIPSTCNGIPNGRAPQPMREILLSVSLVGGNSGSPIVFLPNEMHPGRTFVAGVQSVGFIPSDVAGMAPIRAMLEKLRSMKDQGDLDLGPPDAPAVLPQNR